MSLEVFGDEGIVHGRPVCGICGKPFDTESLAAEHQADVHENTEDMDSLDLMFPNALLRTASGSELARLIYVFDEIDTALSDHLYTWRDKPGGFTPVLAADLEAFADRVASDLTFLRRRQADEEATA